MTFVIQMVATVAYMLGLISLPETLPPKYSRTMQSRHGDTIGYRNLTAYTRRSQFG